MSRTKKYSIEDSVELDMRFSKIKDPEIDYPLDKSSLGLKELRLNNVKRRKKDMNLSDAVDKGFKIFSVKTTFGISYLELVDEFRAFNIRNLSTGNVIVLKENYEIFPVKNKPSEKKLNSENEYRAKGTEKKAARVIPVSGPDIPEKVGQVQSKKTEAPSIITIIENNLKNISDKEDVSRILKAAGFEPSKSTITWGWFLTHKIPKLKELKIEINSKSVRQPI